MSSNEKLRIALGSDHAGFRVKSVVKEALCDLGHEAVDFGTDSEESTDYPDYAHSVSRAVAHGEVDRGVLVCGSGIGMSMSANRHSGVRAALVWSEDVAEMARRHNNANTRPAWSIHRREGSRGSVETISRGGVRWWASRAPRSQDRNLSEG